MTSKSSMLKENPEILAASLKNGNEFVSANNVEELKNSAKSLFSKGFLTVEMTGPDGKPLKYENGKPKLKVVSKKGEIVVGMKDGVEYVLRFGDAYRGSEDEANATGESRYIYAFARLNPNLLEQPEYDAVPSPLAKPKEQNTPKDQKKKKKGEEGPEGEKGKQGKKSAPALNPPGPPPNFTPPPPPNGVPSNLPADVSAPTPSAQPAPSPANDGNNSSPVDEFAKKKAERDNEISRIKASNASKKKEFDDKVAKAQTRVKELNENLAGWYYVISNEVYEKIRLDRKDFVKEKEKETPDIPEEVAASHILISYKGASRADADITRSKEDAKAEAERIRELTLKDGNDFAVMAREHSDGPSSTKGGDLGKFKFEVMAKPFSEAAFALEVGAISEVVETDFGFHVIKRTE